MAHNAPDVNTDLLPWETAQDVACASPDELHTVACAVVDILNTRRRQWADGYRVNGPSILQICQVEHGSKCSPEKLRRAKVHRKHMRIAEFVIEMARNLCDVEIPACANLCNIDVGRFTSMFNDDFDMGIDYDLPENRHFTCNSTRRMGFLRTRLVTTAAAPAFDWLKSVYTLLCDLIHIRDHNTNMDRAGTSREPMSNEHTQMMLDISRLLAERCVCSKSEAPARNQADMKRVGSHATKLCERYKMEDAVASLRSDTDAITCIVDAMESYDNVLRRHMEDVEHVQDHPYGAPSVAIIQRYEGGRETLDLFASMLRKVGPSMPMPMQQALVRIGRADTIVDWNMLHKNATDRFLAEQLLVVWVHKHRTVRIAIEQCRSNITRHLGNAVVIDEPAFAFIATLHPPECAPPAVGNTATLPQPMHCALNASHIVTVKLSSGITRSHLSMRDEAACRLCTLVLELISRGEFEPGSMHKIHTRAFSDFFYTESTVVFHHHRCKLAECSLGHALSMTKKELVSPQSQFTQAVSDAARRTQRIHTKRFHTAAETLAAVYGHMHNAPENTTTVDDWIRLKLRADIQRELDYKVAQNDERCMRKAVLLALNAIDAQRARTEVPDAPSRTALMRVGWLL